MFPALSRVGEGRGPKSACTKQNCSFSFREKEQYVHCAAEIGDDRKAPGSETQRREKMLTELRTHSFLTKTKKVVGSDFK